LLIKEELAFLAIQPGKHAMEQSLSGSMLKQFLEQKGHIPDLIGIGSCTLSLQTLNLVKKVMIRKIKHEYQSL
jgi:hypothetical protein